MNYIILDMEWDSTYHPHYKRFLNQILQIGAVKLDEKFNIIDTLDIIVKSSISKKISKRFSSLTGITKEMMLSGLPLEEAVTKYNNWIGEDTLTMTWSNSDLFTIIENERYLLKKVKFKIDKYLDLQKYIQSEMSLLGFECKSQISLANAAETLGITTDNYDLHTAKDDSLLCAAILKSHYCRERFDMLIKDTSNPEFYKRLCYKPFYINDMSDKSIDKSKFNFRCDDCGTPMKRMTKWQFKNRNFTAKFFCDVCCKKYNCRISFKKTYDDVVVKKHINEIKPENQGESADVVQPVSEKV